MEAPLAVRLSWALVAFITELDNEFEHRAPHTTTLAKTGAGPWLVSWVMYSNFLQYVPEAGSTEAELRKTERAVKLPLHGMRGGFPEGG